MGGFSSELRARAKVNTASKLAIFLEWKYLMATFTGCLTMYVYGIDVRFYNDNLVLSCFPRNLFFARILVGSIPDLYLLLITSQSHLPCPSLGRSNGVDRVFK